jgi:hypothetical protein
VEHTGSTRSNPLGQDPEAIKYTSQYVKRLLAESVYIYAKLTNPGGSVILTSTGLIDADRGYEYSSGIGNPFHLDLIELSEQMKVLSKVEREALVTWAMGLTAFEAAQYLHATGGVNLERNVQKRRERGYKHLTKVINEQDSKDRTTDSGEIGAIGDVSPDKSSKKEE